MSDLAAAVLAVAGTFVIYLFYGAISRARARYAQIIASRNEAKEFPEELLARKRRQEAEQALHVTAVRTRRILEAYRARGGSLACQEGKRVLDEHAAAHRELLLVRGYAPERDAYLLGLKLCEMDPSRELPRSPYE